VSTRGCLSQQWQNQERNQSSNYRELKTVLICLQDNKAKLEGKNVVFHSDNSTTIAQINGQSSPRHPHLLQIVKKIWKIRLKHYIQMKVEFVPGIENTNADYLSRLSRNQKEWNLSAKVLEKIKRKFGKITFDLFANPFNAKHKKFFSRFACPTSEGP